MYLRLLMLGCIAVGVVAPAEVHAVVLNATDTGFLTDADDVNTTGNYHVGSRHGKEFRNFFVFDLSSITAPIDNATLRLFNVSSPGPGYLSPDPTETYSLFDVTTPISTLTSYSGGAAAYADLASGTGYGSTDVSTADNGEFVEVTLNAAAISALSATVGEFAFGSALTSFDHFPGQDERIFGYSHYDNRVELVINVGPAVPEPSTYVMGVLGLVALGLFARRRVRVGNGKGTGRKFSDLVLSESRIV